MKARRHALGLCRLLPTHKSSFHHLYNFCKLQQLIISQPICALFWLLAQISNWSFCMFSTSFLKLFAFLVEYKRTIDLMFIEKVFDTNLKFLSGDAWLQMVIQLVLNVCFYCLKILGIRF